MTKVYIVDDHSVVIEGIYSLLQKEKDFEVVGYASNAENCLQYFTHHSADVILMDISLPDMNGVDLCKQIKKKYPGIMVLALTTFNQGTYIRKMMESGASGYLLKNAGKQEIVEAIRIVTKGKTYLSFDAGQSLKTDTQQQSSIPPLTKREKEVLSHIAEGLTNAQISEKLFISVDTVDTHRKNLHTKLNVKNTAMLIRFAVENSLL
jgi:DNA-binding NarL/FixJ family response regulator